MVKYNFYFQASNKERRPLAQCDSLSDCFCVMQQFMKERNYKSYYTRMWVNSSIEMVFDVGSWTEFFIWTEPIKEERTKSLWD